MGSSRGNCEIVEAKDEPSTIRRPQTVREVMTQDMEQRPPIMKKARNKGLQDDINKLFEAVNLRSSRSLDLSDSWRNASKKPMKSTGTHSPVTGFSEPVSLKQALRGLCISQAAEVAAMKRLSMPSASPRMSEAGKTLNLCRSVLSEADRSGHSPARVGEIRTGVSPMIEESTSYISETLTRPYQDSGMKSATQSSCSSPSYIVKPNIQRLECSGYGVSIPVIEGENNTCAPNMPNQSAPPSPQAATPLVIKHMESSPVHPVTVHASEVDKHLLETVCSQEAKHNSCDDVSKPDKKDSASDKVPGSPSKDTATSMIVVSKGAPKLRRKVKLHTPSSTAVKSNKNVKPTRSTSRTIKPLIRNKNLVIKKPKKVPESTDSNLKKSYEVNSGPDHSSGQLICQRCQCSLNDTSKISSPDPPATTNTEALTGSSKRDTDKSGSIPTGWENGGAHVKTNTNLKLTEKGDISQSSKSSICDFSSSTTSPSEDSSLCGSICGNKPHMSKDSRSDAINLVRKQYGFVGLSHFNLLKKLGSGDIGTVYLAELIGTNCPFAIKVMDNEFLGRRKKMPRAQTEREILRMLDHPFLPTLYSQFTSDNLSCLVMEFCPGGDLHVLRQKQPGRRFPEQAARFYVAEVLLALEYLHMLGIVYRDLKPENILVREDGHIMLTDFDLSLRCSVNPTLVKSSSLHMDPPRVSGPCAGSNCIDPFCAGPSCKVSCFSPSLLHSSTRTRKLKAEAAAKARSRSLPQLVAEPTEARSNSFVGTHEYLAPEIIKGEGHGSAVDWWTLGIFLYELLYGKTPFKGAENEETLTNVVCRSLRFPDSPIVGFQARDLIRALLVKDPENRFGTETGAAEIKRHPFFEGLNWALIRCAVPPQIPELYDVGNSEIGSQEKGKRFMECSVNGEHLEFELF